MSEKKQTIVERALGFLKADDESTAKSIYKTLREEYQYQIMLAGEEIKDTRRKLTRTLKIEEERLTDIKQQFEESFLQIDLSIKNSDGRRAYAKGVFQQQITNAQAKLDGQIKLISDLQEEAKEKIEAINKEITFLEKVIAKLS